MWFQIYFFLLFVIQYCLSVSDPVFIKKTKIEYDEDIKCKIKNIKNFIKKFIEDNKDRNLKYVKDYKE